VTILESAVRSYLLRRVKEHGGEVRKVRWIGRRGAPDEVVLANGKHPLVELKKPKGGKLEPHQAREHARLRKAAFEVCVLWTFEDVDKFIGRIFPC
jgi:hypothetical protein